MKKLLFIIMLFAIGCSQSKEDKIETAFKEYANAHFDDPASFKEIVSIDSIDTISTLMVKHIAKEKFLFYKEHLEYADSTSKLIGKYLHDKRYWPKLKSIGNGNSRIKDLLKDHVELLELYADVLHKGLGFPVAEEMLTDIVALNDTVFLSAKMSYRTKNKEGLKLKTCYLYSDTLYNNIVFKEEKMKAYEVDVFVQINEFEETFGPLFRVTEFRFDNNSELLSLLEDKLGPYK